jgi:hypothetical protein
MTECTRLETCTYFWFFACLFESMNRSGLSAVAVVPKYLSANRETAGTLRPGVPRANSDTTGRIMPEVRLLTELSCQFHAGPVILMRKLIIASTCARQVFGGLCWSGSAHQYDTVIAADVGGPTAHSHLEHVGPAASSQYADISRSVLYHARTVSM